MSRPVPPLLLLAAGRRPRPRRAPKESPRELVLHMATADLLRRFARPDWQWTHIASGEKRDPRIAAKLKAMGLRPGWPDFALVAPGGQFHALELKRKGEDLNEAQKEFHDWCVATGAPRAVCDDLDQVILALSAWGALKANLRPGSAGRP